MACTIPEELCHFSTTIHAAGGRSRRRCRAVPPRPGSSWRRHRGHGALGGSVATQRSSHEDAEPRDEPPAQRRRVLECAPAFDDEAGERSATRLIVDAIAREDCHLESRGRGRPWISPRLARWHRPPQRCSFCSLLPPALSHHDMSFSATADRKQGNRAHAHQGTARSCSSPFGRLREALPVRSLGRPELRNCGNTLHIARLGWPAVHCREKIS